jgi:hypothetical protein
MSRPSHVYLVVSPRPRTGKTLLARALVEYYRIDARLVGAFDLDPMEGALSAFLPDLTTRAEISDTRGQVALIDELVIEDGKPKVVDVGAYAYEAFFELIEQIDFAATAPRQSVETVVLFAANTDAQSARAYARLRQRFPGLALVPVYNDGVARGSGLRGQFPATSAVALPLRIPMMSPSLRALVDTRPFSFADFRRKPAVVPEILHAELDSWLRRVHLQFREMDLRLLLSSLRGSFNVQTGGPPGEPLASA